MRHLPWGWAGRIVLAATMLLALGVPDRPAKAGLLDELLKPIRDLGSHPARSKRKPPQRAAKPRFVFRASLGDRLSTLFSTTRDIVDDPTGERPGTVVVDTRAKRLYLVLEERRALRYAIGVGREGFTWRGATTVGRKAEWPDWTPPPQMVRRQPYLPRHMSGGPDNPLGARALYLHAGGKDTMFRIHGTNEAWSIGRNVSSGCIRLMNDDVVDLYARVPVGARVVVR